MVSKRELKERLEVCEELLTITIKDRITAKCKKNKITERRFGLFLTYSRGGKTKNFYYACDDLDLYIEIEEYIDSLI